MYLVTVSAFVWADNSSLGLALLLLLRWVCCREPGANLRARVYVGSCPFEISDKQLRAIFEPFGAVKSCELLPATDATSGHAHRGYGFIEFEVRTLS